MVYKSYNYVYLPYILNNKINYIYLLCLYSIAEKTEDYDIMNFDKSYLIKSTVCFTSYDDLERQINTKLSKFQQQDKAGKKKTMVSASTLSRFIKKAEYNSFFEYRRFGMYQYLFLNNDFTSKTEWKKQCSSFVRLSPAVVQLLLEKQDNLLAQYVIYLIHACGISQNKTDFTAKQFLGACGYSTNNNGYLSKICEYNNLLKENRIIKIEMWRDEKGRQRNTYSMV